MRSHVIVRLGLKLLILFCLLALKRAFDWAYNWARYWVELTLSARNDHRQRTRMHGDVCATGLSNHRWFSGQTESTLQRGALSGDPHHEFLSCRLDSEVRPISCSPLGWGLDYSAATTSAGWTQVYWVATSQLCHMRDGQERCLVERQRIHSRVDDVTADSMTS